jgi:hypothetical protein
MTDVDISNWFAPNNEQTNDDLAFLLDEKAIEVLNFDLSDTAMNLEHTPSSNYDSNSSSDDEGIEIKRSYFNVLSCSLFSCK